MGSRLNLYCGVEEGEEGGYRSALGLGGGWNDVSTSAMYPWGRASRAGGTRARYTRAIEGANVRPFVAFSRLDT